MTKAWKAANLENNTEMLKRFAINTGTPMQILNNGYQIRIDEVLDVYPVGQKYHIMATGERGEWQTLDDVAKLLSKAKRKPFSTEIEISRISSPFEPGSKDTFTYKEVPAVPVQETINKILSKAKRRHWWQIGRR